MDNERGVQRFLSVDEVDICLIGQISIGDKQFFSTLWKMNCIVWSLSFGLWNLTARRGLAREGFDKLLKYYFRYFRTNEGLAALENNDVMTRSRKEQSMSGYSHNSHVEILPVLGFEGTTYHRLLLSTFEHHIM